MKFTLATALVAGLSAGTAIADATGDAAAGEKGYNRCKACHAIVDADGNKIVKGGRTGPNLYGLPGRTAGTAEGFKKFKKSIKAAGEDGLVWDEASFIAYVQDPTGFLREFTGDGKARSGMSFRVKSEEDAKNIWAYIVSVSPDSGS